VGEVVAVKELVVVVLILGATEVGYRLGARRRGRADEHLKTQTTTVQVSALGLFGLLLAFAMSMAEGRFTSRRIIVAEEANAIGTAFRRSYLLPAPEGDRTRGLMIEYVRSRHDFYLARADRAALQSASLRGRAIQAQIWEIGVGVANQYVDRGDVMTSYLESLNAVIEIEGMRYAASHTRTPKSVFWIVLLVAVVSVGATGYACGLNGPRYVLSNAVLPVMIGLACAMVMDLDDPQSGLIRIGDGPMLRLQQMMHEATAR
jgi:hypothetical protein